MKDFLEDKFWGKTVKIAVPHAHKPGELFFYYGVVSEVTDKEVVVFTEKRMLRLDRSKIQEISLLEDDE
jgi:hypothetical protein